MATTPTPLSAAVDGLMADAIGDLASLVRFRSVFGVADLAGDCAKSAAWVSKAFAEAGIPNQTVETSDGSMAVIGHRRAPEGKPTVTLYAHHDVQPAGPAAKWSSDPFTLTERDGRWYGRGAADCKGNIIAHLTALRALGDRLDCGIRLVIEGSEEAGGEGLDHLVDTSPELFASDTIIICDSGNVASGVPTLTTSLRGVVNLRVRVDTLESPVHSGQFGGAAPDALAALIALLATLRDEHGNTTIDGVETTGMWSGAAYDPAQFRTDATLLDGTDILGSGAVADMVWARPAITVIALDAARTDDAVAAVPPSAEAILNLRVPPGADPDVLRDALIAHLHAHIRWGAKLTVTAEASGKPFAARTDGPMYAELTAAMSSAYGRDVVFSGQGGSIPLCTALAKAVPAAEIALIGVEDPQCRIHAPNESVDPQDLRRTALSIAIFLQTLSS